MTWRPPKYDLRNPAVWLSRGTLYNHYSQCNELDRYEHFSFKGDPRLYCRLTQRFYFHKPSMDALQSVRHRLNQPIRILSGHRSPILNAAVGGAVRSSHKFLAFDITTGGGHQGLVAMARLALDAGFTGIGFGREYIHVDRARPRYWFYEGAEDMWREFVRRNIWNS